MSLTKIQKVIDFKRPIKAKDLKSFLGLVNYFRDHIPDYANLVRPLQVLIRNYDRNRNIVYDLEAEQTFIKIKEAISKCTTLFFMDDTSPVFLHTDASKYAIGAYLFQGKDNKEYPIAFFLSSGLNDTQIRWSTYEKEAYAIYYAITELSYLIRDSFFTLRTDHANLVHIRDSGSDKVIRWKLAIQEYNFHIEHIKGEKNFIADALSRLVIPAALLDKSSSDPQLWEILAASELTEKIEIPKQLYHEIGRVHNSLVGHRGLERTLDALKQKNIQQKYFRKYIQEFIRKCPCCQKFSQIKPLSETFPFTTTTRTPMSRLNIDTMGPFPSCEGFQYILVVVDCFTRFVELFAMKTTTAIEAAKHVLTHAGRYGCPEEILTDGGPEFANEILSELTQALGSEHLLTTPVFHRRKRNCRTNKQRSVKILTEHHL